MFSKLSYKDCKLHRNMAQKNLLLICFLLFLVRGADCPDEFVEVNDVCYYKKHLDVLQDFIDRNESLYKMEPHEIGYQEWTNNRLTYLYLGDQKITSLPDSVGLLQDLNILDLRANNLTILPEGICNIYPYYAQLNLSGNQICPPHPFCFDYISNQDTKECASFTCPKEYIEIQGECYYKDHILILQSIIDSNNALTEFSPLELGNKIGYQQWENGKLTHLNLVSNQLTILPDNLCTIYKYLKSFDVSNNFICPPYPACFEYLGYQNIENCKNLEGRYADDLLEKNTTNQEFISYSTDISKMNAEYFQKDLDVLQGFIDNNTNLEGMRPLEIGRQKWLNMRLVSLDMSSMGLTEIPAAFCNIYSNLTIFDFSNNAICPPYPNCIAYIGNQDRTSCTSFNCPDGYIDIEGECYYESHLKILLDFININASLQDLAPLELAAETGLQKWRNGKLDKLILSGNQLMDLPNSICSIYSQLTVFDVSNNSICPPYPSCIENIGYQNTENCLGAVSCPEGYVIFDDKCYYYSDLEVLIDFTVINPNLKSYHPLLLGIQVWKNNRLQQLNLDGLGILVIPENIHILDHLENLNLNNNKLEVLPENLCKIYSNLKSLEITNNLLCPPYLQCFDFIGHQNTENCEHSFCPFGYLDMEEECYYEKDIAMLQDFISQNESLSGRQPLDIGVQKWKNMRLHYLYLGVNQLTTIPESICKIIPQLKTFNISQNNICPPYPACVEEYIGEQDASGCP